MRDNGASILHDQATSGCREICSDEELNTVDPCGCMRKTAADAVDAVERTGRTDAAGVDEKFFSIHLAKE